MLSSNLFYNKACCHFSWQLFVLIFRKEPTCFQRDVGTVKRLQCLTGRIITNTLKKIIFSHSILGLVPDDGRGIKYM